ncbi:MAG: hypothetical protein RLZZ326_2824 [Planctomycetota bacterium]|jgi:hypothetical protein
MNTFRGDSVDGPEFFAILCANEEFCAELGRAVLAGGRLETALKRLLSRHGFGKDTSKATLGRLIEFCRTEVLIAKMIPALETLRDQRNYLIHNIHSLLSDMIQETILEREGLVDSDVHTYTERAWLLKDNLNGLAEILERDE